MEYQKVPNQPSPPLSRILPCTKWHSKASPASLPLNQKLFEHFPSLKWYAAARFETQLADGSEEPIRCSW